MNTIKQRLLASSSRAPSGKSISGRRCLICRLVGGGLYASIGIPPDWATANGFDGRRQPAAHRVAWALEYGPIPKGMKVLHRCDQPKCVEPLHLFIGTQADNVADMVRKGRCSDNRGERNPSARLTEKQVRRIFSDPRRQKVIAADYGVSLVLVEKIKGGSLWKHLRLKEHLNG